jgi:hypothetical protein
VGEFPSRQHLWASDGSARKGVRWLGISMLLPLCQLGLTGFSLLCYLILDSGRCELFLGRVS